MADIRIFFKYKKIYIFWCKMFFFQNIFHNLICYTQPANCRPNSHHGINGSNHQLSSIKSHVFSLIQRQFWPLWIISFIIIYIYIYEWTSFWLIHLDVNKAQSSQNGQFDWHVWRHTRTECLCLLGLSANLDLVCTSPPRLCSWCLSEHFNGIYLVNATLCGRVQPRSLCFCFVEWNSGILSKI